MSSQSPSILVIEDDSDIRISLQECLELEGYRVLESQNGREAIHLLEGGAQADLILLDLMMPVMGGKEFLEETATHPRISRIPVLLLSGAVDPPRTNSVVRVLKKPIDLDDPVSTVWEFAPRVTP